MSKKDEPIYMFNVLWLKPVGGNEIYQKYIEAVRPLLKKYQAKPLPIFKPDKAVIGTFDADLEFFVEYPNWDVFKKMISDPEYKKIQHFREETIIKSNLIRCKKIL